MIKQLEPPRRGIGVLVASDETDAAAGGATSISFQLEFNEKATSAEVTLIDNIGRVPGFYDHSYKQKVGIQLRRPTRPGSDEKSLKLNAYYQWPSVGIRSWNEEQLPIEQVFGKSIWIDIALDRSNLPQPSVRVLDRDRQLVLFEADFTGRADYSLRPKVEYRVISDRTFSIGRVLSFVGLDTARRWHEDYVRNFTTTVTVPTIRIISSQTVRRQTPQPTAIASSSTKAIYLTISDSTTSTNLSTTPSVLSNFYKENMEIDKNGYRWLSPPTWLLISSGCLLLFLFFVFFGTVLYLCSRRPGFVFVTATEDDDSDRRDSNRDNKRYQDSSTPSPRHHYQGSIQTQQTTSSASPMLPTSDDDYEPPKPPFPMGFRITEQQQQQAAAVRSLVVTYPHGLGQGLSEEEFSTYETLPRRQQLLHLHNNNNR